MNKQWRKRVQGYGVLGEISNEAWSCSCTFSSARGAHITQSKWSTWTTLLSISDGIKNPWVGGFLPSLVN